MLTKNMCESSLRPVFNALFLSNRLANRVIESAFIHARDSKTSSLYGVGTLGIENLQYIRIDNRPQILTFGNVDTYLPIIKIITHTYYLILVVIQCHVLSIIIL